MNNKKIMKKCLYLLFSISLTFVCCNNQKSKIDNSEIEKQAIETFKESVLEDSKDATFDKIKTVFTSKNLCILNADISGLKGLNKVEYLFITLDGKNYEAFHDLNDDSIFVSEPTFNKISKGTIYENQDYATAILFRSVRYMNTNGREVGNHNKDFIINSPLKTGLWEISDIEDEFGDKTGGKCLRIIGKGTYSSDYESDTRLLALLFVYKNGFVNIQLYKDKKIVDDFSERLKIKDGEGDVHEIHFSSDRLGQIEPSSKVDKIEFADIIEKEGMLSAIAKESKFLNFAYSNKTYNLKFNLDGLEKAMKYLKHNSSDYNYDEDEIESENSISLSEEEYEEVKNKIKFNVELDSVKEESDVLK